MVESAVLVLGDVGRSPRMQYHAASLLEHGSVRLIGFQRSTLLPQLQDERIKVSALPECPWSSDAPFVYPFVAVLKLIWTGLSLLFVLMTMPRPRVLLVQTPPAIPVLVIAGLLCRLRNIQLIVDWHNLGFTILGGRIGREHILTRVYRILELYSGRLAHDHLCVSKAMQEFLARYKIR